MGDIEGAKQYLKEKGLLSAQKKLSKQTGDGAISLFLNPSRTQGVMAEINCETDFVARTDLFLEFSRLLVKNIS
jgi:elongation factor Ts